MTDPTDPPGTVAAAPPRYPGWTRRPSTGPCRVYWGSHGCMLDRGHEGDHVCSCSLDKDGNLLPHDDDADNGNVGRAPYYGPNTSFYGEDVPKRYVVLGHSHVYVRDEDARWAEVMAELKMLRTLCASERVTLDIHAVDTSRPKVPGYPSPPRSITRIDVVDFAGGWQHRIVVEFMPGAAAALRAAYAAIVERDA